MTTILALLAIAYAAAWMGFWTVELRDVWQHVHEMPNDALVSRPFAFAMLAGVELVATFFWPLMLARGAGFVWDAAPDFGEDEDEEDDEEEM